MHELHFFQLCTEYQLKATETPAAAEPGTRQTPQQRSKVSFLSWQGFFWDIAIGGAFWCGGMISRCSKRESFPTS